MRQRPKNAECDSFASMKSSRIGFVGLGRMGANMALRLNELGYQIAAVFDANVEKAAKFAQELGSKAVDRVSDVSRLSDVIFTVVTDDAAMREIYFGPENLFSECGGKLFINCATISPQVHVEIRNGSGSWGRRFWRRRWLPA